MIFKYEKLTFKLYLNDVYTIKPFRYDSTLTETFAFK